MLADGGNAVDAAIATSLALATVEPWMSGLGGGGYMMVRPAGEGQTYAVSFGMVAPGALDPADYPLTGEAGADMFGWPAVEEDRNMRGPLAVAVPGQVAGLACAHERFGTWSWSDLVGARVRARQAGHGGGLACHRRHCGVGARARARFRLRRYLFCGRLPAGDALDRGRAAYPVGPAGGDAAQARRGRA